MSIPEDITVYEWLEVYKDLKGGQFTIDLYDKYSLNFTISKIINK